MNSIQISIWTKNNKEIRITFGAFISSDKYKLFKYRNMDVCRMIKIGFINIHF